MSADPTGLGDRLRELAQAAPGALTERFGALWIEAADIWLQGGWAMIAIAVVALVMFAVGMGVWLRLRAKGFTKVPEAVWRRWIDRPAEREGPIGELLDRVGGADTVEETARRFAELRASEITPFERDLRVMKTCVSAAPLVGLLGTVTGMLSTFAALAGGSGGDKTMALVAKGISEALITTETGLVIALPGMFFQYQLARRHESYRAFLAHLETVCTQTLHVRLGGERRARAQRAAKRRIAERLRAALAERSRPEGTAPPAEPSAATPRHPAGQAPGPSGGVPDVPRALRAADALST